MKRPRAGPGDDPGSCYVFGVFRLESDGSLFRGETPIPLPLTELIALRVLLAHAGQAVTPKQLRSAIWGDRSVAAGSLSACIESLRARLEPHVSIDTVYKRGYRLSTEVSPRSAGPSRSLPRLAILPFATEFGVSEYLGAALAEETGAQLMRARPAAAWVLCQDSVSTLARRGLTPQQIGSLLEADLVLTGTVRALPAHYRLGVTMWRAGDGCELWMEDLLVERSRFAMLERELADRVTFRLQEGGLSIYGEALRSEPDDDSLPGDSLRREAWETYQHAHQEWQTYERHHMQDALQRLQRSVELDPLLIPARVDLANLCIAQSFYGFMPPAVAARVVKDAASSIRDHGEAILPALGWISFHVDRDLSVAVRAFSLSAHLPHDPWITRIRSMFALSRHRMDEATEILRSAMGLDPWSPWIHGRLAWTLHLAGKAAESVTQAELVLERFPEDIAACLYGAMVLAYNGDIARGVEIAEKLAQRSPYSDVAVAAHAYTLACAGREVEARVLLERLRWMSQERYVLRSFTAAVYVVLGENDTALKELGAAEEARCPWFFQMLADPRLKPLRGHAEFKAMLKILDGMEAAADQEAEQE